jgi:Na+/melibiose symporter-like transporter
VLLVAIGANLSAVGLAMVVFGVLGSGTWGWVEPKPDTPVWLGLSPVVWLLLGGAAILWCFFRWVIREEAKAREPLVLPSMLANHRLRGGLTMFFFQFLIQAGMFFTIPLFLSVVLGLSALETGLRLLPLSITLLAAAIGVPRFFPEASPRRVVRIGVVLLAAGLVSLIAALEVGAGAEIISVPLAWPASDRGPSHPNSGP